MDHLTPQQRHNTMAAIHNKNTKPEMIVRRGLWKRGFRYRLNHKRLPGHPDLVLGNTELVSSSTVVYGMGILWIQAQWKVLPASRYQAQTMSSGWRRFAETKNVTRRNSASWLKRDGIALPFGNAN